MVRGDGHCEGEEGGLPDRPHPGLRGVRGIIGTMFSDEILPSIKSV